MSVILVARNVQLFSYSPRRKYRQDLHTELNNMTSTKMPINWTTINLLKNRAVRLKKYCKESADPGLPGAVPKFISIDTLRLTYLPIPKAGCTNWKRLIMRIEGDDKNITIRSAPDAATEYGYFKQKRFKSKVARNENFFNSQPKFVIVREPFERLISAYEVRELGFIPLVFKKVHIYNYIFINFFKSQLFLTVDQVD